MCVASSFFSFANRSLVAFLKFLHHQVSMLHINPYMYVTHRALHVFGQLCDVSPFAVLLAAVALFQGMVLVHASHVCSPPSFFLHFNTLSLQATQKENFEKSFGMFGCTLSSTSIKSKREYSLFGEI